MKIHYDENKIMKLIILIKFRMNLSQPISFVREHVYEKIKIKKNLQLGVQCYIPHHFLDEKGLLAHRFTQYLLTLLMPAASTTCCDSKAQKFLVTHGIKYFVLFVFS